MRVMDPDLISTTIPCPHCEGEGEVTLDPDEMRSMLENYWEDEEDIEQFMIDYFQNLNSYEENLEEFKKIYEE